MYSNKRRHNSFLRLKFSPVLPPSIRKRLSYFEKDCFNFSITLVHILMSESEQGAIISLFLVLVVRLICISVVLFIWEGAVGFWG